MNVNGSIPTIGADNFPEIITKYERVVVDFTSAVCAPCSALAASLEEVAPRYPDVHFFRIDIDESPTIADDFEIDAIPYLVFFNNGEATKQVIGYLGHEKLENDILRFLRIPTKNLTGIFADGDLWELDDTDSRDMINNVDFAILLFEGSDDSRLKSQKRIMRKLADEFQERVFFGVLDSTESTQTRYHLKIPRKQAVTVFIHKGSVVKRMIGKVGTMKLRQGIADLLLDED